MIELRKHITVGRERIRHLEVIPAGRQTQTHQQIVPCARCARPLAHDNWGPLCSPCDYTTRTAPRRGS